MFVGFVTEFYYYYLDDYTFYRDNILFIHAFSMFLQVREEKRYQKLKKSNEITCNIEKG